MAAKPATRTLPAAVASRGVPRLTGPGEQFPLIHIRDDDHLDKAIGVIDWLLRQDLDEGAQGYLMS